MIHYKLEVYDDETNEILESMDTADFDNLNIVHRRCQLKETTNDENK